MSGRDLKTHKLAKTEARKLVTKIMKDHPQNVIFTGYADKRMSERNPPVTRSDVLNVLKSSSSRILEEAENDSGQWRYRLKTNKIIVVIAFGSETSIIVINSMRK